MNRREFVLTSCAAAGPLAHAKDQEPVILYGGKSVTVPKHKLEANQLWIASADLPRVNGFEVKPQGACRADLCIPIPKTLKHGEWFNLSGFARKLKQAEISDSGVWSYGEIQTLSNAFVDSRIAPDFAVPDRKGRVVHLSDFRGKKVLIVTWASW
jgi:hypothetical protein